MRRFTLLLTAAAMLAALVPAAARAQDPTSIPPPEPIVIKLGHTPTVQLSDGGAGLPYLGSTVPYNAGDLVAALTAFHDNGTYDREVAQIDAIADAWVKGRGRHGHGSAARAKAARRATHRRHHGGANQANGNGKLAIVLDIDETSLSNYSAIVADKFTFGPNSQAEATNQVGVAIKPTLQIFNDAKARGIAVFFVTGRPEAQRDVTVQNLKREGYEDWAGLTLKPAAPAMTTVQYKSGARAAIEQQGYRIIANIGDQYSDLAGGHADRAFKLANPFYFLP